MFVKYWKMSGEVKTFQQMPEDDDDVRMNIL